MKKVGLIFGGPSNEHEVSISSANNVAKNIDPDKFQVVLIYWDKLGDFFRVLSLTDLANGQKITIEEMSNLFDVAFLVTHGKYGEDGVLQAMFEGRKIKYTGCHVLSSAICMDKLIFKKLMNAASIPQARYVGFDFNLNTTEEIEALKTEAVDNLKFPLFVKPANSGSSVGITMVENSIDLGGAIEEAKKHDFRILIEEGFVNFKEVEVAVLGNDRLEISDLGQLIVPGGFYDYDQKYKLGQAKVLIPADLSEEEKAKCRNLAEKAYKICGCSGLARVDFFVGSGEVFISEINTLPGFTDISMYPKLMGHMGVSYDNLITRIIDLAY